MDSESYLFNTLFTILTLSPDSVCVCARARVRAHIHIHIRAGICGSQRLTSGVSLYYSLPPYTLREESSTRTQSLLTQPV